MNFPPIFYVLRFWESVSNLLSGLAGLLYLFGVLPAEYAIGAAALLQSFLTVIKWFGIDPALRSLSWSAKARKLLGR